MTEAVKGQTLQDIANQLWATDPELAKTYQKSIEGMEMFPLDYILRVATSGRKFEDPCHVIDTSSKISGDCISVPESDLDRFELLDKVWKELMERKKV